MDYDGFKEEVLKKLQETHGDGVEIALARVKKNNGADYDGISFQPQGAGDAMTASAILRTAPLYEGYSAGEMDIAACAGALWEAYEKNKELGGLQQFAEGIRSWEAARKNVYPALLSMEKNIGLLPGLVVFPVLDLAVVFVIHGEVAGAGCGIVKVTTEMLEDYGISRQELYDAAMENLKDDGYHFQDMDDAIREISLLGDMERPTGTGMYILPSSIHETIFVPADRYCAGELDQMVAEINELQVAQEERLVDHCYFYDGKTGGIRMRP